MQIAYGAFTLYIITVGMAEQQDWISVLRQSEQYALRPRNYLITSCLEDCIEHNYGECKSALTYGTIYFHSS